MTPPNVWTAKASRGATVSVLAVASSFTAAAPSEALSRTHEPCQVVKPMSTSNALAAPRRKARPDMDRLRRRAAERRARIAKESRETPEAMRAIMGEFAQLERDFAGLRRSVNKRIN